MAQSTLLTHCGARVVTREELDTVDAPPATDTWFPLKHATVLDRVVSTLHDAGFQVESQQFALSRSNARFFGTLDLKTPVVSGVTLAVGVRNSTDKSLPISFCAGNRVFCCDNLAFRSEIVVARKHTRFGEARFNEAICQAVQSLNQFKESEEARIRRYQYVDLTDAEAESLMLRGFEQEIVSYRLLPRLIKEWRSPLFEDFTPRTLWSLENCFTAVLADVFKSNPNRFCALSIALQGLLAKACPSSPQLAVAA